jgi:aminoglycoside phosphotransferase family enzyme/predicted kinase
MAAQMIIYGQNKGNTRPYPLTHPSDHLWLSTSISDGDNCTMAKFSYAKQLVDFLSRSSSYPDETRSVRVVETHISWVFLTDRFAYKLKKPVRFEFLDFSTPELRRKACFEELRLNRRLAPQVYLDVLPITRDDRDRLKIGGPGLAIDWVVLMRRLPAEYALDVLLQNSNLPAAQADAIADHLVTFYKALPSHRRDPDGYCRTLLRHVRANEATLMSTEPRFRRAISQQLRYLAIEADQLAARAADGRVIDGHGDLRPEHIFAIDPPAVIDCIEFSDEFRQVDIADELAFLAMECRRLGDGGFGEMLIARYQDASGDRIPNRLLAFYRSYRATVRAKVSILRGQQTSNEKQESQRITDEYFDLANCSARELGRPSLVIVGGLSGTGKSTLASALAESFGAVLLSTDQIRRSIFRRSSGTVGYGEEFYRPEDRDRVYDEMLRLAKEALKDGRSLILDGTFAARRHRGLAYELGATHHAATLFANCRCPRDVALARIGKRIELGNSTSEARPDIYETQLREFEAPGPEENFIAVDTTRPMSAQLRATYEAVKRVLFE